MRRAEYRANPELARFINNGLVERGFDMATLTKFEPQGGHGRGISHMVSNLMPMIDPKFEIPMIPIFINEYFPPLPAAARCFDLGVALRDVLAERPERVAIYASGGLSHLADGALPNAYVDESFDRWVLRRLERNDSEGLKQLFTFDADTLHGGTGETRAWISVAGAMDRPATVIDYIPAYRALTGLAFACWPAIDG
jgi:protocatechuate 4,5-dioxygenase beta chain